MQELRILHLEDDPFFADMVESLLKVNGMSFRIRRAPDWESFESALFDIPYDLILSDHNVPGGDGLKALSLCKRHCPAVPFIFLSGMLGEEIAIESLKNGAADYVLKSNISRFIPTVMRTLSAFRETVALRAAEARIRRDQANLHGLIENTTDAIWSMDLDFNILIFNSAASLLCMKMTGQPMVEGSCLLDRLGPAMQAQWREAARRIRNRDRFVQEHELSWAGGLAVLEIAFHPIATGKVVTGMAMFGKDVTERKRLEAAAGEVDVQRRRLNSLYRKMRVPLHGLARMTGLLAKTQLDDGQRRYIGMMGASVRRLSNLHEKAEAPEVDIHDLLPEGLRREEGSSDTINADEAGWSGLAIPDGKSRKKPEGSDRRDRRMTDNGPLRVLVVEDNPVNQIVVTGFLEKLGMGADIAVNGQEAVAAYVRREYDLVLMDLQMPVMDGFTATAGIRALEAKSGRRAWIAAMTANITAGTKEKCLNVGMDGHMTKPLKLEILQLEVELARKCRAMRNQEKASETAG